MNFFLEKTYIIIAILLSATACGNSKETPSDTKFESAHSIALEARITEGKILSKATEESEIKEEIKEQLLYTIGQLNGFGGGVDMNRLTTDLKISDVPSGGEERVVEYSSQLFVSWPRGLYIPDTIDFYVPKTGSYQGLSAFFDEFGSDENSGKKCLAAETHDVSQAILWYYYRPEKIGCPIVSVTEFESDSIVTLNASLKVSEENTENKFPEYDKVWEDEKLVITAIFGKAEYGAQSNWDAGVRGYKNTYREIIKLFGEPASTNLDNGNPSVVNNETRLTFETEQGLVDIHLFLIDDIKYVDADFRAKYNARTKISDFTSYSGHSGLGANIRALAKMGKVEKGHYQIFLINGCDTFAYVDDSLRQAHLDENPDSGMDKYVDVITNAMPAYFHAMPRANLAVIEGLFGKTKNYREILSGFDAYQKAAVTGEQDNSWPLAFDAPVEL